MKTGRIFNRRSWIGTGLGVATAAAVVLSGAGVAHAAPTTDAAGAIAQAAPESLTGVVSVEASAFSSGEATVDLGSATAVLPDSSAGVISIQGAEPGYTFELSLPFADENAAPQVSAGLAIYDNGNGTATVPVTKDDGSVQVTTVIGNPSAPHEFTYDLSVPDGGRITETSEGGVAVLDSEENAVVFIAPAWAKDAGGVDVATHYEIHGSSITQVVNPSASALYPIVADPQVLTFAWGQGIKFNRSETKSIANGSTGAEGAAVLCGFIPVPGLNVACGLAGAAVIGLKLGPIRTAAANNKCSQINIPWGSGPVLWFTYEVSC